MRFTTSRRRTESPDDLAKRLVVRAATEHARTLLVRRITGCRRLRAPRLFYDSDNNFMLPSIWKANLP